MPEQTRRNLFLKICSDLVCFGVAMNTANIYARVRLDGAEHPEATAYGKGRSLV